MSKLTESVYLNLINVPEPSPELQERVYAFASKAKSSTLMLALIRLKNLTDDLDEKLGVNPSAYVLAEWIARKPRSVETLESIVIKTKSQKVLRVLAENQTLTQETYSRIAKREDPGSSIALYANPAVSEAVKLQLGPGLGLISTNAQEQALRVAINTTPELFKELVKAPRLSRQAWNAICSSGWIATDAQVLLLDKVEQDAYKGFFTRDANTLYRLANSQTLSTESLTRLRTIAQSLDVNGLKVASYELVSALAGLIKHSERQTTLAEILRSATSQEEFEIALSQAVARRDAYAALPTILSSPYFNMSSAKYLVPLYGHWGVSDSYYETAKNNEDALFALIATYPHQDRTGLIERISNPAGMILRLFSHFQENDGHHPGWILSSPHLDQSLILGLTLKSLIENGALPDEARNRISDALIKAFKGNTTAWETFDSLIVSHEGSIAELISVVLALCEIEGAAQEEPSAPTLKEEVLQQPLVIEELPGDPAPKVKALKAEILLGEPLFDL